MSYSVGRRHGSDPELLWLWHRPEAMALIQPLAWESPYAVGAAQEIAKIQKKSLNLMCLIFFVISETFLIL